MKNNSLFITIILVFFIFISLEVTAYSYSDSLYKEKTPLMDKEHSRKIGFNLGWLGSCGENAFKSEMSEKIKKLSYADWRKMRLGWGEWESGYKYAVECANISGAKTSINSYFDNLRRKVNSKIKSNTTTVTKKKKTNDGQKLYCLRNDGIVYSVDASTSCYNNKTIPYNEFLAREKAEKERKEKASKKKAEKELNKIYNENEVIKLRLIDLKELFDLGLITEKEYTQKKQAILDLL